MLFRQIFDPKLAQYAYLVGCQQSGEALLIDPERDVDRYIQLAAEEGLDIVAVAETHIHADFLSGSRELAEGIGAKVYVSDEGDADWKYAWVHDGDYDFQLLKDGDTFKLGNIEVKAVHTPGHTPEHLCFLITDHGGGADEPMGMVSGDFVFVGALGRPDLLETAAGVQGTMEASAEDLYASVQDFMDFPDFMQIWPGHGAGSACGKALGAVPESTVGYERRFNVAIDAAKQGKEAFVDYILDGQPEPPLYFARMKRENKMGPAVLGALPSPKRLTPHELGDLAGRTDVAVVDTRINRSAFMAGHLPGSLYAPMNKTFNTIAGSYVEPEMDIYLIVEEGHLDEAIRDLVRIGLDNVVGYATPETLQQYQDEHRNLISIPEIDFEAVQSLRDQDDMLVVDVRGISEFEAGHVPGAYNVAHTRMLVRKEELPTDKTLLVHCQSGARASGAAPLLARFGYDVQYVNDEISNWAQIGELDSEEAEAMA